MPDIPPAVEGAAPVNRPLGVAAPLRGTAGTTGRRGTGVGLSIVQPYVSLSGGGV